MSGPPAHLDEPGAAALIEAKALTKRFGDDVAVDGIDFSVRRGEVFGFLGPNGAGKTTTVRMIACVSPVTDGKLRVLGMNPVVDGPAIRSRLGVVPQDDNLDTELTVWDNLVIYGRYFGLPMAQIRERAAELLHFARLDDRRLSRVDPLSGGMKRRLTIVRSLINRPTWCCSTSPPRASTRRPATCSGSGSTGSNARASPSCSRRTTWTRPSSSATGS
jgi:lipooligosaccharide transport system ATP-binding protein